MPAQSPERKQAISPELMPAQSPEMKQATSPERMPALNIEKPEQSNKLEKLKKKKSKANMKSLKLKAVISKRIVQIYVKRQILISNFKIRQASSKGKIAK